jgi:phage-related protein
MKPIVFLGDALERMRDFSIPVRREAGFQLDKVQRGLVPDDFKSMPAIGKGVHEIRIRDTSGIYRVVYVARFQDVIYVLHAFKKKTQRTSKIDIELAKSRFTELTRRYRS